MSLNSRPSVKVPRQNSAQQQSATLFVQCLARTKCVCVCVYRGKESRLLLLSFSTRHLPESRFVAGTCEESQRRRLDGVDAVVNKSSQVVLQKRPGSVILL